MISRKGISRLLLALACLTTTGPAALAQVSGTSPEVAFAAAGVEALRKAAADGDAGAKLILANLLDDKERTDQDHVEAVALLQEASDAGLIEASVRLADILRTGITGVAQDRPRAADLYEVAAETGDNAARRSLADMYLTGRGVERDAARAAGLLEAAAAAGNVDARLTLAGLYARGEGVAADAQKAIALYSTGLATNKRAALIGLGALYRRGADGLEPQPETAMTYYHAAAEQGDVGAGRAVADMLIRGEGTAPDIAAGMARLAALAEGDPATHTTIGDYYLQGKVVPMNVVEPAAQYQLAAEKGVVAALSKLGDLYRTGAGAIEADASRAYAYFVEAGKLGDAGAARKAAEMLAKGEGTPADLEGATSMLERLGDASSLVTLGDLYSRGEATEPQPQRAIGYYEAAAGSGNAAALRKIGDLYRQGGGGVAQSGSKAVAYYDRAAEAGDNGARRVLASMLIDGRLVRARPTQAIALLEAALAVGDAQAGMDLGSAYARGALGEPNLERALAAFDGAAAKGNATASWRKWVAVLSGPLAAKAGKVALAGLQEAASANLPGASVELARLIAAGKIKGARPSDAIPILVASNEPAAIRYLLQLYRDGAGKLIKPNRSAGIRLLEASSDTLGPDVVRYERVLLNASLADAGRFDAIGDDFKSLTPERGISALQHLRRINQNAYVYVVQQWLKETGHYSGSLNGTLSKPTIAAFNAACADADLQGDCISGPLSPKAATAIATFMYRRLAGTSGT